MLLYLISLPSCAVPPSLPSPIIVSWLPCLISFPFMFPVRQQRPRKGGWKGLLVHRFTSLCSHVWQLRPQTEIAQSFSQEQSFCLFSNSLKIQVAYMWLCAGKVSVLSKLLIEYQLCKNDSTGFVRFCTCHLKMSPKIWYLISFPEDMAEFPGVFWWTHSVID